MNWDDKYIFTYKELIGLVNGAFNEQQKITKLNPTTFPWIIDYVKQRIIQYEKNEYISKS